MSRPLQYVVGEEPSQCLSFCCLTAVSALRQALHSSLCQKKIIIFFSFHGHIFFFQGQQQQHSLLMGFFLLYLAAILNFSQVTVT